MTTFGPCDPSNKEKRWSAIIKKKEPQLPAWDDFTFRVSRLSKVTS
jgi:hypothetical protein